MKWSPVILLLAVFATTAAPAAPAQTPADDEVRHRAALIDDPDDVDALLGWLQALEDQDRAREAVATIERTVRRHLGRDDLSTARRLAEGATTITPEDGRLWWTLGGVLLQAQSFERAQEALERARELGPADSSLWLMLGAARWENGRLEEAEAAYRRALAEQPDSAVAHFQLGRFLSWQGEFDGAIAELEAARELGFGGGELAGQWARALEGMAERSDRVGWVDVVAAYRHAVEMSPDDYQLRHGLARALGRTGDREGQRRETAEFQRLYREHQELTRAAGRQRALIDAARLDLGQNAPQRALERLAELAEPSPDARRVRALAHLALDQRERAIAELESALAVTPQRTDLRALLTEIRTGSRKN